MKEFTFQCVNCKTKQKVYSNVYLDPNEVGSRNQLIRFQNAVNFAVVELGWVKMGESDVAGFHDFLCPKCT